MVDMGRSKPQATYVPKVRVETLLSGVLGSLSLAPVSSPERKLPHASSMLPCGTGAAAAAAVSVKLEPQAQAFGAGGQSGDGDRDVVGLSRAMEQRAFDAANTQGLLGCQAAGFGGVQHRTQKK